MSSLCKFPAEKYELAFNYEDKEMRWHSLFLTFVWLFSPKYI